MRVNILDHMAGTKIQLLEIDRVGFSVLEVSPSKYTSNNNVRWLMAELGRLYKPLTDRIKFSGGKLVYSPSITIWWEVFISRGHVKFYLVVPNREEIKSSITRQVMKTWKQANVKEVPEYIPQFDPDRSSMSKLTLKHHSVLSLDTTDPTYSPLDSILNAKHYLDPKTDDCALLQIGLTPQDSGWNDNAATTLEEVRSGSAVPRKKGQRLSVKDMLRNLGYLVGLIAQELTNLLGDFFVPGWQEDTAMSDSLKGRNGEVEHPSTRAKSRSEPFKSEIRLIAQCDNEERRKAIVRALVSGFDPLEGDNRFLEKPVPVKALAKELNRVTNRNMVVRMNGDVLVSIELAKIINVPDQKAQIEHYNELSLVSHRSEAQVPADIFIDDGGIAFATYEDTDGVSKNVYFGASNKNLLCMPRVIIGEPGTGKTTFAVSCALDSFNKGYGCFVIDAADGKLVQRILDRVSTEQRNKVVIIDFLNTDNPIGLGWNEIFRGRNIDVIEDLVVEEVLTYVQLVSGTELNMRARQWVESAVKVVYTTPDATLQDVENMLNNSAYRASVIPNIEDPELRTDWEYYHNKLKPEERKTIYDEAFRRLAPVIRKKALKNFILQRPKKNEKGEYAVDFRKWMDEGYMVLVKANETLGETLQTALVSFTISKFNLAMVSREDILDEDDRKPCFIFLDEPDHYIKGSERWRNMLTRFRKYRAGLNLMFHGWQQLKEADKDLPKIIRKSGPHYVIFQTDEDNLLELKPVIEPEFKVADVAKGLPQYHAIIRLKMYSKDGGVMPAFMAKAIDKPESRYDYYDNNDLYTKCAEEMGRPKKEVMDEIFRGRTGSEFDLSDMSTKVSPDGDGDLDEDKVEPIDEDEVKEEKRRTQRILEHEVSKFIQAQIDRGEDPDEDLILELDSLLEEG